MLTLAVNVAVMTVALYAVLAYMTWTTPAPIQSAWDAPGIDPALLKAIFLIFVELMLVTAVALFFSTFSTPMLSAALTFGLYVVGHFNADLRNFEQRRRIAGRRRGWRAACITLLPDLSAFDVKTQVVHGLPVAGRLPGADERPTACSTSRALLLAAIVDLLAAGLQVTDARRRTAFDALAVVAWRVVCLAGAVGLQIARDRLYAARERARSSGCCTCGPARRSKRLASTSTRWRPTSTGSARFSTTAAIAAADRRRRGATSCCIRCST